MAARHAVLGMEQASFYYGSSRVFRGVSFLLDDARTALVGENGAGKSTLLKCLTGALELNAGQAIRERGLRATNTPHRAGTNNSREGTRAMLRSWETLS
jgi:ATPase subunit of ABC transporter with duplicated ATPase domains